MALDDLLRPWSGAAVRHIPHDSPYGVLDFRFASLAADNRWNERGDPTLDLASDRGVALAEFARHFEDARSPALARLAVKRAVFRLEVSVEKLLDLRDPSAHRALSLDGAPACFRDKGIARATAQFIRHTTRAQALLVPSVAFLDHLDHWVLVLFLDKLPTDHRHFIRSVEAAGSFQVGS